MTFQHDFIPYDLFSTTAGWLASSISFPTYQLGLAFQKSYFPPVLMGFLTVHFSEKSRHPFSPRTFKMVLGLLTPQDPARPPSL